MSSAAQQTLIRPMTVADLDRVMEIAADLKQAPHWLPAAYVAVLDPQTAPRRIALVVAERVSGVVTAFAVASLLPPQAELESIAVAVESQRQGLATRLFSAFAPEFQAQGITEVTLEVRAGNRPALGFYLTLGFVETGRRLRYYTDPVEDAILLSLRIPSASELAGPQYPPKE